LFNWCDLPGQNQQRRETVQQVSSTIRVACVGEAMAELMLGCDETQAPALGFAGDTMNTAVYLNRMLGVSSEVFYVSMVGQDTLSDRLIRYLEDEKINTSTIGRSSDRLIGLYAITTDRAGERTFSYWRSESAARTLFQQNLPNAFTVLSGFDVIYLSAISLAILPESIRAALLAELARLRKDSQVTIAFDSNYRPALWESVEAAQRNIAAAWCITDIALPSIDDETMLFNDIDEVALLARLRSYGAVKGALKRGALGPRSLSDADDPSTHQTVVAPECSVNVVDTTAAGDSFNAGYLSATLTGKDEQAALQAGHACALRVISHRGAIIPRDQW